MAKDEDLSASSIALCVFNAYLSYTAIALNSVIIYAVTKTLSESLPKTLLLSLAVSDLGVGLIVQPLYIAVFSMRLEPNFENSPAFQKTFTALLIPSYLFSYASFFGVTVLTVDRFLAIHFHLRYNELVTHKRVVAVVISVWVLSAILSLIRKWVPGRNDVLVIFATIEIGCLITTAVLYCKIYLVVRRHINHILALQVQQEEQNDEMANAARLRKSAIATFYVYFVFLICYLPRTSIFVASRILGSSIEGWLAYAVTLVFLNSSLNPLIYCWRMRHIRHSVIDIVRKILPNHN